MSEAAVVDPVSDKAGTIHEEGRKYLVVGCGPAALIAVHTLVEAGHTDIEIVTDKKEKSKISGAQFLHKPIIGDPLKPDGFIDILRVGFADAYANKVYGDSLKPTSFTGYSGDPILAWSLQQQYDRLWSEYDQNIQQCTATPEVMNAWLDSDEYDVIISTVPPQAYCSNPVHTFPYAPILLGEPVDPLPLDNCILYNGRPDDPWYRMSSIFGHTGIELGQYGKVEGEKAEEQLAEALRLVWESQPVRGKKPLGTNCDCGTNRGTKLVRAGRFGTWDRRVLLHNVPSVIRQEAVREG